MEKIHKRVKVLIKTNNKAMQSAAIKPFDFLYNNQINSDIMSRYKRMVSNKWILIFRVRAKGNRLVLSMMAFICLIKNPVSAPTHCSKTGNGLTSINNNSAYKTMPDKGTTKKFVNKKRLGN
jgi:hypothetical protein